MSRSYQSLRSVFAVSLVLLAVGGMPYRLAAQAREVAKSIPTSRPDPRSTSSANLGNRALVSTALRTNSMPMTVSCTPALCENLGVFFFPSVATIKCPAAAGGTCTYYVHLETQASVSALDSGVFQFLVDGAAPSPGPTDIFGFFTWDAADPNSAIMKARSYAVVAQASNSFSNQGHTIEVQFGCIDATGDGCSASIGFASLSIGLYTP
jgi:hypothetical protein